MYVFLIIYYSSRLLLLLVECFYWFFLFQHHTFYWEGIDGSRYVIGFIKFWAKSRKLETAPVFFLNVAKTTFSNLPLNDKFDNTFATWYPTCLKLFVAYSWFMWHQPNAFDPRYISDYKYAFRLLTHFPPGDSYGMEMKPREVFLNPKHRVINNSVKWRDPRVLP